MYKRYWIAKYVKNGFEFKVFLYGTEQELWDYTKSEFGYQLAYSGATDKEVEAGKVLGMKFYMM